MNFCESSARGANAPVLRAEMKKNIAQTQPSCAKNTLTVADGEAPAHMGEIVLRHSPLQLPQPMWHVQPIPRHHTRSQQHSRVPRNTLHTLHPPISFSPVSTESPFSLKDIVPPPTTTQLPNCVISFVSPLSPLLFPSPSALSLKGTLHLLSQHY